VFKLIFASNLQFLELLKCEEEDAVEAGEAANVRKESAVERHYAMLLKYSLEELNRAILIA
jgi:hypothetical protein